MSFSVLEVAEWAGGRVVNSELLGDAVSRIRVNRPVPLSGSKSTDLAFFFSKSYEKELLSAAPGILITGEPFVQPLMASGLPWLNQTAIISCPDPYLAMGRLSEKFADRLSSVAHCRSDIPVTTVHSSAVVDPSALLGESVTVGPHCVVERGAQIGDGTVLYPGCYVGPDCVIGKGCVLFPGVVLYEWTRVGDRVRIHSGSVLGSDGFGYAPIKAGGRVTGHQKIFHLGRVVVGDDVEIGANCCIDRSTLGETRIGSQAKIDNDVHVGHNAQVGEGAVICGGTALAGRAHVGRFAYVGGLTGITNDVYVGDGAKVGALALVTKDVPAGGTAVGNPQREYREHFKAHAVLTRLAEERKRPKK